MQESDLLLSFAEIAGVFVGFGALIAARNSGDGKIDISSIRWVVSIGIWSIVSALAPILLAPYGVSGHELWLACSLLALALMGVMIVVNAIAPENVTDVKATFATVSRLQIVAVMGSTFWLPLIVLMAALVAIVLGLLPGREDALYRTAVGLGLVMGAMHLFVMVFWNPLPGGRRPPR